MSASAEPNANWGEPRWIGALLYATAATVAVCWPAWPGYMSYDSLLAYEQSVTGVQTMTWPPLHSYLFWLSRSAGAGPWGLFLVQTFVLFAAAAVAANLVLRRGWQAAAALGLFAAAFVAVPPMLGTVMTQWRDATTASLGLAATAAWLLAARSRSAALLGLAAALIGCAVALRYNAFALFALIVPIMLWRPYIHGPATGGLRLFVAGCLAASLGLAWASTHWRLPDLQRLPAADNLAGIQEFDLIGISACAGRNYLPPAATDGWPITPAQIREIYDPRHVQKSFEPHEGVPAVQATDANGETAEYWRKVVPANFDCYLTHRLSVFIELMGIAKGAVFYPIHGTIDPNRFHIALAHPAASRAIAAYVNSRSAEPWRRPALLYLLATIAVVIVVVRRHRLALPLVALLGGGLAYPALLFVAAPAADARYIFPSNVFCAFVCSAGLVALLSRDREKA
jgi:hypothetical protein